MTQTPNFRILQRIPKTKIMEEKLITIANDSYASALMLQNYFEANGIACYLKNVNLVQPNISDNVKVLIAEHDLEKAVKLLSEFRTQDKGEMQPRKILVPIDFSKHSKNAAYFALALAKAYGAELQILHVYSSPIVDMVPFSDMASIQIDIDVSHAILQQSARKRLVDFFEQLKEYAYKNGMEDVHMGYAMREGYAGYGIIDSCRIYQPGMLIMGTKSEGFNSSELVSKVATEVVRETQIPLLVIPEGAILKGMGDVKRVLYVTRFSKSDFVAIRKMLTILSAFSVEVICANVCKNPDDAVVQANMSSLKDYIQKVSKTATVKCELIQGEQVVQSVKDYIQGENIDLFALTMLNRSIIDRLFNPSLTRKMLSDANIPLLIFPQ